MYTKSFVKAPLPLTIACIVSLWLSDVMKGAPDSKIHGAKMGLTWVLSAPDGPHVGPMNLAIRGYTGRCSCIYQKRAMGVNLCSFIHIQSIGQALSYRHNFQTKFLSVTRDLTNRHQSLHPVTCHDDCLLATGTLWLPDGEIRSALLDLDVGDLLGILLTKGQLCGPLTFSWLSTSTNFTKETPV